MDIKAQFLKDIRKLEEESRRLHNSAVIIGKAKNADISVCQAVIFDIYQSIITLYKTCQSASSKIPVNSQYQKCYIESLIKIHKIMFNDKPVMHFLLDGLLPHKITFDISTGKEKYYHNKDLLYSRYRTAVEEYLKENEPILYDKKVLVAFVHHYNKTKGMMDHDNLETKTFIDAAIKNIFIVDDNPMRMDLYHSSVVEEGIESYTEVFVGYPDTVIGKLKEAKVIE